MKKSFLILMAVWSMAWALHAIDLKAIEVDVQLHPDRYQQLLQRFENADTTLTVPELSTIYFGYSFTPGYDPRDTFDDAEEAYDNGNYAIALQLCREALKLNPVSLDLNVLALAAADHLRDKGAYGADILTYGIRSDLIATAILESGHGTSAASPFHVIASADMRRILRNVLGIDRIVDRTKVGSIDAIKVTFPGNDRQHILYFDRTRENDFFSSHPVKPTN